MSLQQQEAEKPPPYTTNISALSLPSVPLADPAPAASFKSLEPAAALTPVAAALQPARPRSDKTAMATLEAEPQLDLSGIQFPSVPSNVPGETKHRTQASREMVLDDRSRPQSKQVTMDDMNDRMAAEALCGLGRVDSTRSYSASIARQSSPTASAMANPATPEQQPLLSLLSDSHPWLGGTLNGSVSAYSATKHHSPRFIQYGADYVETAVGNMGRRAGVEGSIRRYLDARRPSELERIDPEILGLDASNKRRKIDRSDRTIDDVERGVYSPRALGRNTQAASSRSSVDSLPPYDENRSPAYEETTSTSATMTPQNGSRPVTSRSWSSQLLISTSGLGAALNEASLRSLKFCLSILRHANGHVRHLMGLLRDILEDYEKGPSIKLSESSSENDGNLQRVTSNDRMSIDSDQASKNPNSELTLTQRIRKLNDEIWRTLKDVCNAVSQYTGGALPEKASRVVRHQLMSVPGRWQRAVSRSGQGPPASAETGDSNGEAEAVSAAHRMLAFGIEGLDMMDHVGSVIDQTIESADRWLHSFGRRGRTQDDTGASQPAEKTTPSNSAGDVKMSDSTNP